MEPIAIRRRGVLLGLLASSAGRASAAAGVAVEIIGQRCVVPVELDGRTARMILDTGAERTVVTRAAAVRLGLRADAWVATTMRGAGGLLESHANVDVGVASVGGMRLSQKLESGALSLSVTGADLGGADGLLGGDLLRRYTVDLDFPRARLSLRQGEPAETDFVRLRPWGRDLLLASLRLDGVDLIGLVDTGAAASLVNARGLYRLGLSPERLADDPVVSLVGLGGRIPARPHRFTELDFGGFGIARPLLLTAAVPEIGYDLTLGMDVLGRQRLVLSYSDMSLGFGR